jgi:hypothetical protein
LKKPLPASGLLGQSQQTLVGGETFRLVEADRTFKDGETARSGEGGLVIRVQLRGLEPDSYPETAGAERMKPPPQPSAPWPSGAQTRNSV